MVQSKKSSREKHVFALHVPQLERYIKEISADKRFLMRDDALIHRIIHILRLSINDECILFDRHVSLNVIIAEIQSKKQVACTVLSHTVHKDFSTSIVFLLPLLKRDDFEHALYSLTEVGATTIQLVFTDKATIQTFQQKDFERAQRIIISAAEQSKNYIYPELKMPINLSEAMNSAAGTMKIFFDQQGHSLFSVAQRLHMERPRDIVLLVGPEGDLSNEEKKMIMSKDFIVCTLTPTVLRSMQATALSAGFVRSLVG